MPPRRSSARLLWAADALLALVAQLRATSVIVDLAPLRERIAAMLLDFEATCRRDGVEARRVAEAREVLAALIDHVVTSMPWGIDAGWRPLGGASRTKSGRSPAQRLLEFARASSSDAGLAELARVALVLGGGHRGGDAGDPQIDEFLARLMREGTAARTPADRALSPDAGLRGKHRGALASFLPLWVSSLVSAALLAVLFFGLELTLGATSDRLYARMAALRVPSAGTSAPQPAPAPRLAGVLAAQTAARSLYVRDEIDRSVIVLPDARLFEPGDSALRTSGRELLGPLAAALQSTAGRIQVIGHGDGSVVRSARYPSEWELTVDRAHAVYEALQGLGIAATRLAYDGRASVEPLPADDPARAASGDGRIEIVLLVGR